MDGEEQRVANFCTAHADTMELQPSVSSLSTAPSLVDTGDNLDDLQAELEQLRAENERLEKQHKAATLKVAIAQSRAEIQANSLQRQSYSRGRCSSV